MVSAKTDPRSESKWLALSDATRRKILDALKSGPRTTGSVCNRFPLSRMAVMKHLDVLEAARLIVFRRVGRDDVLIVALSFSCEHSSRGRNRCASHARV